MAPDAPLSLLFDVFAVGQRVRALLTDAMADSPLRPEEYAIHSAVSELAPVSTSDLARVLGMPVTTAHDHVRALLERGHATRRRHPRDGRAWLLELTDEGREAHRAAGRHFERAMELVRRALPVDEGEVRTTLALLARACEDAADALHAEALDDTG